MNGASLRASFEAALGFVVALLSSWRRSGFAASSAGSGEWSALPSGSAVGSWEDSRGTEAASRVQLLADDHVDDVTRRELASAWREGALAAHAALVGSTQRALDLVSLGAPPELVAHAYERLGDEVRGVKLRCGIARGIDGRTPHMRFGTVRRRSSPRHRAAALSRLATETVLDVALAESWRSRTNAKLARRTTERTIGEALEEISSAEARRAAHAWKIVRWCVAEGGPPVNRALRAVAARFPLTPLRRALPDEALEGGWERWGVAGEALERREHAQVCQLVERTLHELVTSASRGSRRLVAA